MTSVRHSLTEKDTDRRTAVCAVCGPVKIRKNGKTWLCANKRKEVTDRWEQLNQGKVNARRSVVSAHHLSSADIRSMTGTCPLCGPVAIVAWGRGYLCANRAGELRQVQQEAPARRCWKCCTWSSEANPVLEDDVCRRCTDELTPGHTLDYIPGARSHTVESLREASLYVEFDEAGMHVGYPDDPYKLDDQQPVPGWKTIGSPLPTR
jgi:hypothetical protein